MNITLSSLFLTGVFNAPLISKSAVHQKNIQKIHKCAFSNFYSHLYFSQLSNKLSISRSKFQFFLDTSVKVSNTYVTSADIRFERVAIYDTTFKCKDSLFRDCQSVFGQGGAIFSVSSTILRNCYFTRCQSELGGAVYSGSDLDCFSTTFINCIGYRSAGCTFIDHPERVISSFCTFSRSLSTNAGALCCFSEGQALFRYDNISACGSMTSNGAIDISLMNVEFQFVIVDQCFASSSTAGFLLRNNPGFTITSTLFLLLTTHENKPNEGAVLTILNPTKPSIISHCSFTKTRKISGFTIFAFGENEAANVLLTNNCFSYPKEVEINDEIIIDDNSSHFKETCDTYILFMLPRYIGYSADRPETPVPLFNQIFKKTTIVFFTDNSKILLMTGGTIGILIWIVYFIITRRGRHRRRNRRERIRALL
ncbi:hypothetical protein TRFO_12395 [Tritrichomonas foetus]|uniref:Right handed beta helix domain-containing protein n=1 Tax=Tritrichomonas foetus TaxID=1144522 RepID=A0A1J4L1P3_9EUKA|nr:hypothetical protein TRFO_12395 [Tritrichomonas foetus]|eukprot:OHT17433.1 hypothetical protein TRFO_12395 [Tritrichomonas foetus]